MNTAVNKLTLDYAGSALRIKKIVTRTPLQYNHHLSKKFACKIYLKREDLQVVRSYKLRGAYNMMSQLPEEQLQKGVVCASAGNHAQGFAYSCKKLNAKGMVFMPVITPHQKINQTKMFGENFIEVKLVGDTFDDCAVAAKKYTEENGMDWMYANCSTTAQRGALDWWKKFRDATAPVFKDLYESVATGKESQRSIDLNSQPDYREKLEVELKELRDSEMWQAGKTVRSLRPENQPAKANA